ncbi:transcription elongation factor GreA [Lactobacillus jensenii]|jgi:transcription elongation factor greA|uniref:Transcription elongation factor GreA n=2 Tax=Lactobacillus jensenii TaxID=109790 RepID=A0A5N1IDN2_LACJE|nr:transcription elongation factor GreA [Lactobacillus jensenii]MCT7875824.1 transcription elongation factor GreA [Lactobacillus iners]EEQ24130.1 transcription elongation factor GreA [Lactobacillus jensenii 269-3]EEX27226.1 prokaryotic transcription elongation factor, GreA/GreB domain protein [Lactobacillus jensenii SJ-7A-US]KAA9235418.1 transcription elongation factor GreA [Lactobacillus jensenii]KAA9258244.1 transcription elongation factor GreA [Lactobacillus jensenii]
MVYFQKMTPQGYKLIEEEIKNLKKSRPIKIKALQEARSLGDLSENSEYTEAKKELRHLESRLRYLDKQLKYAEIITPNDDKKVDLGKKVKLRFEDDETSDTYEIVGRLEADLEAGKISFDSPLGVAIMKKEAGSCVTVEAPAGSYEVTIEEVL